MSKGNLIIYTSRPVIEISAGNSGAGGQNNTASNVGTGVGVFKQKVGVDLQFKSLIAGTGVSIISGTDDITISSTASAWGGITGTLSNQTDLQNALNAKQTASATLSSLSSFNTNGILVQTATSTFAGRTIIAGTNKVLITNGTGVAGNPTVDIVEANLVGIPQASVTNLVSDLASKLSANQTITLSGEVTGSGATSITTTISNDAVTFAKMQNINSSRLLGRATAGSGDVEEISLGPGLTFTGGTLQLAAAPAPVWGAITGTLSSQTDLQNALNAKVSTTLNSANILVGNVGNVATAVSMSGDATISNTGAVTNTGLKGVAIPTLATGYLKYTGAAWVFDAGGGGSTYTSSNGITLTGSNFTLGGTLVQNTSINGATYTFSINNFTQGLIQSNDYINIVGGTGSTYTNNTFTSNYFTVQNVQSGSPSTSARFEVGDIGASRYGFLFKNNSGTEYFAIDYVTNNIKLNFGSDAVGDIYRRNSAGYLQRLPLGTASQVLRVNSGATDIEWATGGGGSVSLPTNEIGYGNGSSITSNSSFVYNVANSRVETPSLKVTGLSGGSGVTLMGVDNSGLVVNLVSGAVTSGAAPATNIYSLGAASSATAVGGINVTAGTSSVVGVKGGNLTLKSGAVGIGINAVPGDVIITTGTPGTGGEGSVYIQDRPTGKLSFFLATPVVKQAAPTTAQGIADVLTAYGLIPTSTISGGGSSLPSQTGNAGKALTTDGTTASWKNDRGLELDSIGTIINETWTNLSAWTQVGSATWSVSAGQLTANGGTPVSPQLANYIENTGYGNSVYNLFDQGADIIVGTINSTSWGIAFGVQGVSSKTVTPTIMHAALMLDSTNLGKLRVFTNNVNTNYRESLKALPISTGDVVNLKLINNYAGIIISAYNKTQKIGIDFPLYSADLTLGSNPMTIGPNTYRHAIYAMGGSHKVNPYTVDVKDKKGADLLIIGDSFSCYQGVLPETNYIRRLQEKVFDQIGVYGGAGNFITSAVYSEVLLLAPKKILIQVGINDASGDTPSGVVTKVNTLISNLTGYTAGTNLWVMEITPNFVFDASPFATAYSGSAFAAGVIPTYRTLVNSTGTATNPLYITPDGLHLNDLGWQLYSDIIFAHIPFKRIPFPKHQSGGTSYMPFPAIKLNNLGATDLADPQAGTIRYVNNQLLFTNSSLVTSRLDLANPLSLSSSGTQKSYFANNGNAAIFSQNLDPVGGTSFDATKAIAYQVITANANDGNHSWYTSNANGTAAQSMALDKNGELYVGPSTSSYALRVTPSGTVNIGDPSKTSSFINLNHALAGGSELGQYIAGSNHGFSLGFNTNANYGGTSGTLSGNTLYSYDYQAGAYRLGMNASGDVFIGPSASTFGFKATQAGTITVPFLANGGGSDLMIIADGTSGAFKKQAIPTGDMTLSGTQTVTGAKTFADNALKIFNPANTFAYSFRSSAIAAARDITLPLLTAADTFVMAAFTQTLTNKTMGTGSVVPINYIAAATATGTANHAANAINWQWNTLAGATGFSLTSTSTAAASNLQNLFNVGLSGANATTTQTTKAATISNTHTGTLSTNIALQLDASGGTTANYALIVNTGLSGFLTTTPNVTVDINGGVATRQQSPTTLAANTNDYAIGAQSAFRLSSSAAVNITGLTGGFDGKILYINNVGSFNLVFTHQDTNSTAANRLLSSTAGNITILPNGSLTLIYDATTQRWRDLSVR